MTEVASAEVPVFPTFQGFRRAVVSEIDSSATEASRSFGDRFRSGLGSVARGAGTVIAAGVATAAVGAGAVLASALSKGLDRALNLQDARAQLQGLGHDAAAVDSIMTNALDSVRGTAFGLDAAATTAAGAVAAGIAPGDALRRTLTLTADAATIARTSMGEMGSIINKVATSGRLTTDVLNQFHDRGVPLLQMVAAEYGVTAEAAQEMVTKGEISFERFQNALETNVGGAALTSGETARGAFANVQAALGRLGAMFVGGAVAGAPRLFQSLSGAIDRAAVALEPLAERMNGALGPAIERLSTWIDGIDFGVVINQVSGFVSGVRAMFSSFGSGSTVATSALGSIQSSMSRLGPVFSAFGTQLGAAGPALAQLASAGIGAVTDGLSFLADHVDVIIAWMPAIVAGFVAWRVASQATAVWSLNLRAAELAAAPVYMANNIMRLRSATLERANAAAKAASTAATGANTAAEATNTGAKSAGILATIRQTAASVAYRVATIAGNVATGAAVAAQWALNAAMSANPIALVVIAIAALVAGLIWFFTQTELGQQIWANFTQFLGEAWANLSAWFMSVGDSVASWWNRLWQGISDWFASVWNGIVTFARTFVTTMLATYVAIGAAISSWWNGLWSGISSFFSNIWNGIVSFVTTYINTVRSIIANVLSTIRNVWTTAWNTVSTFVSTAWSNIVNGVSNGIGNVLSFVRDLPGRVVSALGNLGSLLLNSGKSLIQGFINGIRSMIGAVGNAVGGVMDFIGGFFPNSPAKRGPFSGSGWTRVKSGGQALFEQFASGAEGQVQLNMAMRGSAGSRGGAGAPPAFAGGPAVVYNDHSTVHNPVAEPDSIRRGRNLQKAANAVEALA